LHVVPAGGRNGQERVEVRSCPRIRPSRVGPEDPHYGGAPGVPDRGRREVAGRGDSFLLRVCQTRATQGGRG